MMKFDEKYKVYIYKINGQKKKKKAQACISILQDNKIFD